MSHPVITVLDTDSLGSATTQMVKSGLKRLPVVNQDEKLVGVLSRLDILSQVAGTELAAHSKEPIHPHAVRLVKDVMTTNIPMVGQDDDLATIIEKFVQSGSHRLIVVDRQGKAIGLLSDSDVVTKVQPASRKNILDALRQIGKPAPGKETAFDFMSTGPLTAAPNLPVVEAVKQILAKSRKWMVVVDADGKPLGLVDRQILLEGISEFPQV
jgi:CBS domain-containing protein